MSDHEVDPVAVAVLDALHERNETLATAESLTGGLIGELLTSVPGASRSYLGGAISYATRLKASLVGVPQSTLDDLGPVAAQTAAEMATGISDRCDADWGVAVTGVAGPTPQDGHPVGQVFVSVAPRGGVVRTEELRLEGDRSAIREQSAAYALRLLARALGLPGEWAADPAR